MIVHLENNESFIELLTERFRSEVLKKVSAISTDPTGEPFSGLVEDITGPSTIEKSGHPTYTIEDDKSVRVRFPLRGNVTLFQDFTEQFLGKYWRNEDGAVSTAIKGNRILKNAKTTVTNLVAELDRGLTAFTDTHERAQNVLRDLASLSYLDRVQLEAVLREASIMPAR